MEPVPGGGRGRREKASNAAMKFEHDVAAVFKTLGARVERGVRVAGNYVDLVVSEAVGPRTERDRSRVNRRVAAIFRRI